MDSKVILISGASRGIGRAVAEQLHAQGYRLSLGVRDPEQLRGSRLEDLTHVIHFPFEAGDADSAKHWLAATLDKFGRLDGLVHCAGVMHSYQIEDEDETALDEMWEVNVKGTLRLTRAALPALRVSGSGRIVSLVSMSGKRIKSTSAGYGMSKYAQLALSHATRNLTWEDGIRCTAICPSWVNTDMAQVSGLAPEAMTQPEDVAQLVATVLALPNSAHVNELTINCNLEV